MYSLDCIRGVITAGVSCTLMIFVTLASRSIRLSEDDADVVKLVVVLTIHI
jgi:hypothetical protein